MSEDALEVNVTTTYRLEAPRRSDAKSEQDRLYENVMHAGDAMNRPVRS